MQNINRVIHPKVTVLESRVKKESKAPNYTKSQKRVIITPVKDEQNISN